MLTFGWRPLEFTLELQRDGDFAFGLEADPGWSSPEVEVEFRFYRSINLGEEPIVWPAAVTDTHALWHLAVDDVNAVLDARAFYVRLRCIDAARIVWGRGTVNAT